MKIIANIFAAIVIFFGVLFVWGAFSAEGTVAWVLIGGIGIITGFGVIYFANKKPPAEEVQNIQLNIELPGDMDVEKLTCNNCAGQLSMEDVKLSSGAAFVNGPYCGTAYQLTEQPKW